MAERWGESGGEAGRLDLTGRETSAGRQLQTIGNGRRHYRRVGKSNRQAEGAAGGRDRRTRGQRGAR